MRILDARRRRQLADVRSDVRQVHDACLADRVVDVVELQQRRDERAALEVVAGEPLREDLEDRQQLPGWRRRARLRLGLDPAPGPALLAQSEERQREVVLGGEVAVQRHLRDGGLGGDRVDPDRPNSGAAEELVGRVEDAFATAARASDGLWIACWHRMMIGVLHERREEDRARAPRFVRGTAETGHPGRGVAYAAPMQEMVIYGVSFDMVGKQPIVLLKTVDSNKFLPIWIGHPEAAAILMKLQGATTPRPMTHDLLCDMLGELDVRCTQVAVTELRDNTFFASITLAVDGKEMEIDSRPSDALALAVRSGAPIFAAEEVIAESAIEFEHDVEDTEEVVEKFKDFLDQVSPEDFAGDDG